MKIHAVIVSYNGAAWIATALQSLRNSRHGCAAIVVDNASNDNTVSIVRSGFPEVQVIEAGANLGFGRGNNLGIAAALRADAVLLLNQDAWVTPEAVGQLAEFLAAEPGFDIVSPLHCSPDLGCVDPNTQSAYLQRHASAYLSDACLGRVQSHYAIHGINAAAWMLRAEVFRHVGGFDQLFFMYGEDDDLIARFAHHGLRTTLLPAARIVHLRAKAPRSTQSWAQQVVSRSERKRSMLLLDLKRPGGSLPGDLLRLLAAGVVQPFANLLANHELKVFLASLLASLRVLGDIIPARRHARLCAQPGAHFLDIDTR